MNEALKIVRDGDYAIAVHYDSDAESPREWDNLGKLFLRTRSINVCECTEDEMNSARVRIPVYKYEHSGIILKASMNGNPFSCPWDSCHCGYIVALADDIRKEYGVKRITKKVIEKVKKVLMDEVDIYSKYLEGEVYGYKTYKVAPSVPDEKVEEEGEEIDSCWGYYGIDDMIEDAKDSLPKEEVVAMK